MIILYHEFAFNTHCLSDNIAVKWKAIMYVALLYRSCDVISAYLRAFFYDFATLVLHIDSWYYCNVIILYVMQDQVFISAAQLFWTKWP